MNAAITEIFSKHLAVKIYEALTVPSRSTGSRTKLTREWTIKNYLGKIPSKSKRVRYGAVDSHGTLAETSFRLIAAYPGELRIKAIPRTGRTHQIRVHLSEYGLPILGDDLYGTVRSAENELAPRLMLHAAQLIFPHPVTGREISVQSPLPDDFQQCLSRITKPETIE